MSSTISSTSGVEYYRSLLPEVRPVLVQSMVASIAIVPCFPGLIAKNALQLEQPVPRLKPGKLLKMAGKSAPTAGIIIALQLTSEGWANNYMKERSGKKNEKLSLGQTIVSSAFSGLVAAPALAVLNGQASGMSVVEAIRTVSRRQIVLLVTRETSFVASLKLSVPLSIYMKDRLGESRATDFACGAVSGATASVLGHPADTAVTRLQKGLRIVHVRQYMNGGAVKATTMAVFTGLYTVMTKALL